MYLIMKRYTIVLTLLFFSTFCLGQEKWSDEQIKLINVDCLHERGFTGKGVTIAHLDDGCDGCDKIEVFKYARDNGYWKGSYDFVQDKALLFNKLGSHGTATLSIVHGKLDEKYTGVAYDANILMARTENVGSETHQEEVDWRDAVDWSIENGADIITSSLQYNEFDRDEGNYSYKDMDGKTTIITNAADYAASKGVTVVTLQGNFGNDSWYYLTAPGDADSVITVGAANKMGGKARFSGFGPTYDGRMKPDVMAMGERTAVAKPDNSIVRGNGTSYAAPAIAGLMACLKQGHPERSNMQLITAVRQSGDQYRSPSAKEGYGYGVADACKADDILAEIDRSIAKEGKWIVNDLIRYKRRKDKFLIKSRDRNNKITNLVLKDIFENEIDTTSKGKSLDVSMIDPGDYLVDVYLSNNTVATVYFYR
jgi:subtilisin family serine protease